MPLSVSRRLRLSLVAGLLLAMAGGVGGNAALAAPDPNVITRSGATLMLNGHAYRFTGMNAYQLGTYWSVNAGCGQQLSTAQLDAFFGSLRPDSVVRFWAFQAQGVNKTTKRIDYTGLDRVFRAAERHKQRLIPVLGNQGGGCDDGHWKDAAWYAGGYTKRFNDDGRGLNVVPFSTWVTNTVNRYKTSPALGMWEPVNEPEATNCWPGYRGDRCYAHHFDCPSNATAALRAFFDKVGAQIKRLDPKHLVASGVIGGGQCGAQGAQYATVHASPYIDVATVHDYGQDAKPLPGDQWNGMAVRIAQARSLKKPLITEEVGIKAGPASSGCVTTARRAVLLTSKLRAQMQAGVRGFLVWNYGPTANKGCTYDMLPTDPATTVLKTQPL